MSTENTPPRSLKDNIDVHCIAFPYESYHGNRKPWVPPGYDVSTTITSHGIAAGVPHRDIWADECECPIYRQRYPDVVAMIQMFFRVCAILLNLGVLATINKIYAKAARDALHMTVKWLYIVVAYSLSLNTFEFVSLMNPHPNFLVSCCPWLFCVRTCTCTSRPKPKPYFPRVPSLYLPECEFVALFFSFFSAIIFLQPAYENNAERKGCPKATCMLPEEYDMIWGYILEVVLGLLHVGFFFAAALHVGKRRGPGWLEAWEK